MNRIAMGTLLFALGATAAPADTPVSGVVANGSTLTVSVSYADLDLANPTDAGVLYRRLRTAARRVCAAYDSPGVQPQLAWRTCYDHALTAAVEQSGSAALMAIHAGKAPARPVARQAAVTN